MKKLLITTSVLMLALTANAQTTNKDIEQAYLPLGSFLTTHGMTRVISPVILTRVFMPTSTK
ncbi:MAG: hypothetical protein PUF37_07560 [Prevotellaceae bacterium]|nr:hypothetical protein [Prevotellaceae bacterium]